MTQVKQVWFKICSDCINQPKVVHNPNLKVAMLVHMNSMLMVNIKHIPVGHLLGINMELCASHDYDSNDNENFAKQKV